MQHIQIAGQTVSRVWFGTWALGGWYYGSQEDSQSERALRIALDSGISAFDTAPVYGFGHSEEILGRVLGQAGFVAGKCGLVWDGSGQFFFETEHNQKPVRVCRNLTESAVLRDCEGSLLRLKRDVINLYQIHWPLAAGMDEAWSALRKLKEQGKIAGIGICNATAEYLAAYKRAFGEECDSVQMRLGILHRTQSSDVLAYARKNGVLFLAYGSLSQGALLGRRPPPGDLRAQSELFGDSWQSRIRHAWQQASIAPEDSALCALRYPLSIDGVSCVIAGIRSEIQAKTAALAGKGGDSDVRKILEGAFEGLDYRGK